MRLGAIDVDDDEMNGVRTDVDGAQPHSRRYGSNAADSRPLAPDAASLGVDGSRVEAGSMDERAQFELKMREGIPIVAIIGDVDLDNVGRLEEAFSSAARQQSGFVIISLADTKYFDSRTLASIGSFGRSLENDEQVLILALPPDSSAARILEISGISKRFKTYPTVDAALMHVRAGTRAH